MELHTFFGNAVFFDEGKTNTGRTSIQKWIEKSNEEYQTVLKTDLDKIIFPNLYNHNNCSVLELISVNDLKLTDFD